MNNISGAVEEIIFANNVNGYTVCELDCEGEVVTAVGYMPFISTGEMVKLSGEWVNHPEYGKQFKVTFYEKLMPDTADGVEKYLASGLIKGVGPATAAKIVKMFGNDTLSMIQLHPERLAEIKGISIDKALGIGQAIVEQSELRTVIMFLQEYGISPAFSMKIYKAYGSKTVEEIRNNPYKLSEEIYGIGFKTADRIAQSLGIDPYSKFRICGGIKHVLSQASANGHTYIPEDKLKEYTCKLLEVAVNSIEDALITLAMNKSICVERLDNTSRIYLTSYFNAEIGVCRKLRELSSVSFNVNSNDADELLQKIQKYEEIMFADMQKQAIKETLLNGVLVVTGGPGTGKTTIIKSIIRLFSEQGNEVVLAAPTGRAAKRMTEATGFEAKTIHRLLEIEFMGKGEDLSFARNEENPIETDAVIIDEMSMVDILLMNHLLKAIRVGTRLILVGDVDQLPSVGAGNVLKDIIASGAVKTIKLTDIYRQAEESMIVVNAHRINRGELPYLNLKGKEFFFLPRTNGDDIAATIVELVSKRLPSTYNYDPMKHIQVLTPTKKGPAGVGNLNVLLQNALNEQHDRKNEKIFTRFTFREGDRVMQIRNNYNLRWTKVENSSIEGVGVFNGDMGIISKIDNEEQRVTVVFDDDKLSEYDFSILDELEPAYAITIHKSQGSEFPVIVIPIFPGPTVLMTRNLVYTAVTRARNLVVIVGSESTLKCMVENDIETFRYSGLEEKLRKYLNM